MIKRDVIDNPESCLNTACDQEQLFILLARDPAAPVAIRAWIAERLRLGSNKPGDEQLREAYECATLMELQRSEIDSSRCLKISLLTSAFDLEPRHEVMSWLNFTALFSEPRPSPCTRQTCLRASCHHKSGPCWSPATFVGGPRKRDARALSLLVFDVDHLTDDQVDEIRGRLGGLRYLMHSTHSDIPVSRCLRIIIHLSRPVPRAAWGSFFHAALQSLAPAADSSIADAGRVYFLPSCPRGANYFTQVVNEGLPLDVDALLATIPPSQSAP